MNSKTVFYLIIAGLLFCQSIHAQQIPSIKHAFTVIAHRADHVIAPENSLSAIDSAIAHHADYVEPDLRTSADSNLVIMHDETIDRTTTDRGKVSKLLMSVLDTCHFKNSAETIPGFEACLQHCRDKINIYLDFKNADVRQTMALLEKYQFQQSVLVYINQPQQYIEWRKWAPQVPLILSLPKEVKTPDQLALFLQKYPAEVLDGNFNAYSPEMVTRAKALGVRVWPDIQSSNEMINWPKALATGFDGLQTDHPQALIQWLTDKGKR